MTALNSLPDDLPLNAEAVHKRLPYGFSKRYQVLIEADQTTQQAQLLYVHGAPTFALQEAQRCAATVLPLQQVSVDEFAHRLGRQHQGDSDQALQMVEEIGDDMDLSTLAQAIATTEDLLEQQDDAPIIRLINALLTEAIKEQASDIHIETFESQLIVRFRVDGALREVVKPKRALAPLLISRIKVMAKLDIAEKRMPQDGRMGLRLAGREVDVRVSTLPSNHGERIVLRLLDKKAGRMALSDLGLQPANHARLTQLVAQPHGIILVTGPTGSGKTTTLYAALQALNTSSRNIMTVEDPIEYSLPGVGQTQVNSKIDMTFARGLRAILRQDPDVVMIGEIRDYETVEIAIQASLTGHLVLSTLHTNSAVGAVTRLQDMGAEPFLLSSSLMGVIAQRLVRLLCKQCKVARPIQASEQALLRKAQQSVPKHLYDATGCTDCRYTGYKGRTGIYEIISIGAGLRSLIHEQASEQHLEQAARTASASIIDDGLLKVIDGSTTLEEVLRVVKTG